jgi:predicted DNA-binding antitoxin AbrB/MazE fold protein
MDTLTATYENGVLKFKRRPPFKNREQLLVRILRKADPIRGSQGLIQVSRAFARQLLTPHRTSVLDR